jgi:hypothetical protein
LHALVQPLNELVFATSDWVDKYYKWKQGVNRYGHY